MHFYTTMHRSMIGVPIKHSNQHRVSSMFLEEVHRKMVKTHNVKLNIKNLTNYDMTYADEWFDTGCVADGFSCMA